MSSLSYSYKVGKLYKGILEVVCGIRGQHPERGAPPGCGGGDCVGRAVHAEDQPSLSVRMRPPDSSRRPPDPRAARRHDLSTPSFGASVRLLGHGGGSVVPLGRHVSRRLRRACGPRAVARRRAPSQICFSKGASPVFVRRRRRLRATSSAHNPAVDPIELQRILIPCQT